MRLLTAIFLTWLLTLNSAQSNLIPLSGERGFQQQIDRESLKDIDFYGFKGIHRLPPSIEVSDCMFVTSESGRFTYKAARDDSTVCGVYFLTDPDRRVELSFLSWDAPCEDNALISFVDGWELNGELFPSPADHHLPIEQRSTEFCGDFVPRKFISSQNAAVIQYRIPSKGKGFTVWARYRKNPTPCNVLVSSNPIALTLRNYGARRNCTLAALYPSVMRVIGLDVGRKRVRSLSRELEAGTVYKCDKRGMQDYVKIGGSDGLDTAKMEVVHSICGLNSKTESFTQAIGCAVTAVRLISSGHFDNSVTIWLRTAMDDEILNANFLCGLS